MIRLLGFALAGLALMGEPLSAQTGYRLPPAEVVKIVDAPPPPRAVVSPARDRMLLVEVESHPSIQRLASPFLRLAGVRLDPRLGAGQRLARARGIEVVPLGSGASKKVELPEGSRIGLPSWSFDGTKFAFTRDLDDGVELWVGDAETGIARPIPHLRVTDILGPSFDWIDDHKTLLVRMIPPDRGPAPADPGFPEGPNIEETAGKLAQPPTYQDLLKSPRDEELFAHYAACSIALVNAADGTIRPLVPTDFWTGFEPSPDRRHYLVSRIKRPFSYRVPYFAFPRTIEILDSGGKVERLLADLPVADDTPRQGVPKGPRQTEWSPLDPAKVVWAEALDDGDPVKKVPHRDRLMALEAPFQGEPVEVSKITHRYQGLAWSAERDRAILVEYDRDRRWTTQSLFDFKHPNARDILFDLSAQDAYNNPGAPVIELKADGRVSMLQDGDFAYFKGQGASETGDRPFLDKINLKTKEKTRLFRSSDDCYESFVCFVGDSRTKVLTRYESKTEPANYFIADLETQSRAQLTHFPDPAPVFKGVTKELMKYKREDGVPLSGTLYLPAGYQAGSKLPVVIWAYPLEYSSADTAGQVRGSQQTFTRPRGDSHLLFLTQGYAVLDNAAMPVVGDPETMNDTYVEQIRASAKAAIDALDAKGVVDRKRVIIAGHSYGAFMTANLLAHTDYFAAGIARSGAYNRTLTPFGFQGERRSFWEAPDLYVKMSPFTYADKIKKPLLLIHGEADNNQGTFPIQSERLFQAIKGNGGTARLVILPHESHGYSARESVLHVLAEMFDWAEKHAHSSSTTDAH